MCSGICWMDEANEKVDLYYIIPVLIVQIVSASQVVCSSKAVEAPIKIYRVGSREQFACKEYNN